MTDQPVTLPCTSREAIALSGAGMYSVPKLLLIGTKYGSLREFLHQVERGEIDLKGSRTGIGEETMKKIRAAARFKVDQHRSPGLRGGDLSRITDERGP